MVGSERHVSHCTVGEVDEAVTGMAIFSFTAADKARVWPLLAAGVFAERADIPAMPWKQLGTH